MVAELENILFADVTTRATPGLKGFGKPGYHAPVTFSRNPTPENSYVSLKLCSRGVRSPAV